jgi:hypothetical protein
LRYQIILIVGVGVEGEVGIGAVETELDGNVGPGELQRQGHGGMG